MLFTCLVPAVCCGLRIPGENREARLPERLLEWLRRQVRRAGRPGGQERRGLRLPGQDREARVTERSVQSTRLPRSPVAVPSRGVAHSHVNTWGFLPWY